MWLFEEKHNQFAHQLNEFRKELYNYVVRRYALTEETRTAIDYALGLISADNLHFVQTKDLLKQVKTDMAAYLNREVAKEALIEYWEERTVPKKTHRKILKGLPSKTNFVAPDKLDHKVAKVDLSIRAKNLRKEKEYGLRPDQNYNQPQE